ncbi:MAG: ATP-binding protein [Myxococcota bacterium]
MEREGASILGQVIGWIDTFGPPDSARDSLARARLLTTFSLCVMFWSPIDAVVLYAFSAPWTALGVLVFGTSTSLALAVQSRFGVQAAGHAAAASAYLTILSASLLNGGPAFQTHAILALIPVVAVSISGIRAGVGWNILVLASYLGMYAGSAFGAPFPRDMPSDNYWIFQVVAACSFSVTLLLFVVMYEHTRDHLSAALARREGELRGIVETARDGLLVIEDAGRLCRVNPAAERLFHLPEAQLLRRTLDDLFPDGMALEHAATVSNVRASRPDGTSFPADVTLGRTDDGIHYVAIVRDVSERHETERTIAEARDRAIEASRAKSSFLANMSHELRTPLNAILGYTELIQEETSEGRVDGTPEDAARVIKAGRHLLSLINSVLDLSKIEAGRLVLEKAPTSIRPLLEAIGETAEPLFEKNHNVYRCELHEELGMLVTDALRLRQVLLNLLSNAAKFTHRGTVTLRARRNDLRQLILEVEDTGIGMTDDQLEHVFQEFVQADLSTTRRFGGTGLGLAIVKRIVELMGGTVDVRSTLGVGSTFSIVLPPAEAHPTAPRPRVEPKTIA